MRGHNIGKVSMRNKKKISSNTLSYKSRALANYLMAEDIHESKSDQLKHRLIFAKFPSKADQHIQ